MMQRETIQVQYFPTEDHIVDDLMNLLTRMKFKYFRERLGMMHLPKAFSRSYSYGLS
jgi:hypothetical protein